MERAKGLEPSTFSLGGGRTTAANPDGATGYDGPRILCARHWPCPATRWSGRRDLNPRHSAWEAGGPPSPTPTGQRVTTVHTSSVLATGPVQRHVVARPCMTARRNGCRARPRCPATAATRGQQSAAREPGRDTDGMLVAAGRAPRRASRSATAGSHRGPFRTSDRGARRPAASRARSGLHGRRPRPARPAPAAPRLNESLVEIAVKPRDASGPRCVRAPRDQRGPRCRIAYLDRPFGS